MQNPIGDIRYFHLICGNVSRSLLAKEEIISFWWLIIWVRSQNCGCLVTWFCYQLIAKPGNKTATVSWPDPYDLREYWLLKHGRCTQSSISLSLVGVTSQICFFLYDITWLFYYRWVWHWTMGMRSNIDVPDKLIISLYLFVWTWTYSPTSVMLCYPVD